MNEDGPSLLQLIVLVAVLVVVVILVFFALGYVIGRTLL